MIKLINEENLAETAKIIKRYVDENSGSDIDLSNYYTKPEVDSTFLKNGFNQIDGTQGTVTSGVYISPDNGDIMIETIGVTTGRKTATFNLGYSRNAIQFGLMTPNGSSEVMLTPNAFTYDGKQIATLADTLTTQELQTLMNGVLFPPPDAYKLKIYNQENVTKNYNPAWEGYAFVEMGEFPQGTDPRDEENPEPVIATGETFTFGGNTFEIWQSDLDETRRFATIGNDWFIFEPLRWLIIATSSDLTDTATYGLGANNHTDMPESGEKVLLLSEFALYRDYFDKESPYTNKFSSDDCDLQVNMNGGFAEMSGLAEYFGNYIPTTEYGTTWYDGTSEQFDVSSSNMFALGYTNGNDANVDTFSVLEYMASGSKQIQAVPTEFAIKTRVGLNATYGSSLWWLRSGVYNSKDDAHNVVAYGNIMTNGVLNFDGGVRPSFILNLKGGTND